MYSNALKKEKRKTAKSNTLLIRRIRFVLTGICYPNHSTTLFHSLIPVKVPSPCRGKNAAFDTIRVALQIGIAIVFCHFIISLRPEAPLHWSPIGYSDKHLSALDLLNFSPQKTAGVTVPRSLTSLTLLCLTLRLSHSLLLEITLCSDWLKVFFYNL